MKNPDKATNAENSPPTRRDFLKRSGAAAVGGSIASVLPAERFAHAAGSDTLRVGLVGCGGRGSGAAVQALRSDFGTRLVAVADAFEDRLEVGLKAMRSQADVSERIQVDREHRFVGFDAYEKVIASDVDLVLVATPPHFRPTHYKACIEAGKHVFAEKPVAVDAPGVRSVLETTALAKKKNLGVLSGLNGRYSFKLQDLAQRVHDGAIGDIVAMHSVRYGSGVWTRPRQPGMTEMEYQMRNWYYFTWLSGDFNVEQFVHQLDRGAWMKHDEPPVRCYGTGGRQARTGPDHGHIYDHFSTVYEYADGTRFFATTRHQKGCSNEATTYAVGTKGTATMSRRIIGIEGENPWEASREPEKDSHQLEHDAFLAALRKGEVINNGEYMAKSTMMAIMARMSAYTGKSLAWDEALDSKEALVPSAYAWDADPPPAEVAVPGVTPFV